jgi:hypothetical protein
MQACQEEDISFYLDTGYQGADQQVQYHNTSSILPDEGEEMQRLDLDSWNSTLDSWVSTSSSGLKFPVQESAWRSEATMQPFQDSADLLLGDESNLVPPTDWPEGVQKTERAGGQGHYSFEEDNLYLPDNQEYSLQSMGTKEEVSKQHQFAINCEQNAGQKRRMPWNPEYEEMHRQGFQRSMAKYRQIKLNESMLAQFAFEDNQRQVEAQRAMEAHRAAEWMDVQRAREARAVPMKQGWNNESTSFSSPMVGCNLGAHPATFCGHIASTRPSRPQVNITQRNQASRFVTASYPAYQRGQQQASVAQPSAQSFSSSSCPPVPHRFADPGHMSAYKQLNTPEAERNAMELQVGSGLEIGPSTEAGGRARATAERSISKRGRLRSSPDFAQMHSGASMPGSPLRSRFLPDSEARASPPLPSPSTVESVPVGTSHTSKAKQCCSHPRNTSQQKESKDEVQEEQNASLMLKTCKFVSKRSGKICNGELSLAQHKRGYLAVSCTHGHQWVWCQHCCNCHPDSFQGQGQGKARGCSNSVHWFERDAFDTGRRNHMNRHNRV